MTEYLTLQKLYYQDRSPDRDATVKLIAEKRRNEESSFRTGIEIASGELFLAVPAQLSILSERLLRVERKVSHLWRDLPGIAQGAYLRGLILDEIMSTNEIEGVRSTRRQIEEALESVVSQKQHTEYKRFKEFARLYLELTDKNRVYPKTPADIRRIYDSILLGELKEEDRPDGIIFRKDSVSIVTSSQKEVHIGVMPESEIIRMLEQMIALVNSSDIPPTFSAIISHFLFEYIHPFYDGNGRTGRYLLTLYLSEPLSLPTVLSLSSVIAENKAKYYKAFATTEASVNHGETTFFVIQMMDFIRLAQNSVIEDLEKKVRLLEIAASTLERAIETPYELVSKEKNVMFQAIQHFLFGAFPEISLENISRYSEISMQTARKYSLKLEEKGLLETVSLKPLKFRLTAQAIAALDITDG